MAASSSGLLDVRDPWCGTLSTVAPSGAPEATSARSPGPSMSEVSSMDTYPISRRSTRAASFRPAAAAGSGVSTAPPRASDPPSGAPSHVSCTLNSVRTAVMPPAWSTSGCVTTTAVSRSTPRFQRKGATTRSPASRRYGPPAPASTSTVRPSGPSITIASPWPTSSTLTRSRPSAGRSAGQSVSSALLRASAPATSARRRAVRRCVRRRCQAARPRPSAPA